MYFVYILQSSKDHNYYVGMTSNLERRLHEHNSGQVRSTKSRRPFQFKYSEQFQNRSDARVREKFLKTGAGREFRDSILKQK